MTWWQKLIIIIIITVRYQILKSIESVFAMNNRTLFLRISVCEWSLYLQGRYIEAPQQEDKFVRERVWVVGSTIYSDKNNKKFSLKARKFKLVTF